jgi:hypothetical protein
MTINRRTGCRYQIRQRWKNRPALCGAIARNSTGEKTRTIGLWSISPFDDGSVKLADWVSYTLTGAEYHSTGAYLGEYAYDGDSLYMTEDGFDVRKTDDGGWETFMCDDDDEGSEKRLLVVGWMEALVPAPQWADL